MSTLVGLLVCLWPAAFAANTDQSRKGQPGDELFTSTNVPALQIEISQKGMERLRGRGWSWGWGGASRERPEVQATILEGDRTYTNVACHLKGSAGSFQPVESKPSFTLNFDKYAKGQRFHGLEKISLNNSVQDPSFLCEKTCRELFNQAGVPAPRADFATVQLNGRKLGMYVLLEGYNRQFLKRHFSNPKGNLYDGGFLKDVDSPLAMNAGDNQREDAILRKVVAAANEPDRALRFAELSKVLDMDRFVTFMAMEVLVCHWDGYCMNKNNYRVFHDLDSNRIVFMPHGMDQMFGVMMAQANLPVRPPLQGLVARAVMDTSEGRRRYFERLAELNLSLFDVEAITNRVYLAGSRLQPVLASMNPTAAANHQREVVDLCDRIVQRKQSLDEQLAGAGHILEFNSAGVANLAGWAARITHGSPLLLQITNSQGKAALQISATNHAIGCWSTKVHLEEGHYVFVGRMQTRQVAADPRDERAGAGLRIDRHSSTNKVLGDTPWTQVSYEFDVPDGIHVVELVCELRGRSGDAWFDPESLKLIRK